MGRAHRQAQVAINAERLLQPHRRHHKAGAVSVPSSMAARMCRMKKFMFFVGSKVFLSSKTTLGWSETQPNTRNGFGHFSYAVASSSAPSMSLAVTVQPPVPGGDEVQSPPVLAQLGASDPCATSKDTAGSLLCLCPQDGDISPLLLPGGPAYKAASLNQPSLKSGV